MNRGYWTEAARALWRQARQEPRRLIRELSATGGRLETQDALPQAESHDIFAAFPGIEQIEVDLGPSGYTVNNLDPFERHPLAAICWLGQPRRILEIGTFNGGTTRILARNSPGAEVFTLDLSPDQPNVATVDSERTNVSQNGVGTRFHGLPEAAQIDQLLGGGTIVWDDYSLSWPAVLRAVDGELSTFHLARSEFAIHESRRWPHLVPR